MSKADVKLALIPLIFVLLRIWGTIDFFWSITREEKPIWIQILQVGIHVLDCAFPPFVSHPESLGSPFFFFFFFIFCFQGIGDSAQGFANCILFCVFTEKVREKFTSCLQSGKRKEETADEEKHKETDRLLPEET